MIVKLTSALPGRAPVYVNIDHIISFSDQGGGCSIRVTSMTGGTGVIAVAESAEVVMERIAAASLTVGHQKQE